MLSSEWVIYLLETKRQITGKLRTKLQQGLQRNKMERLSQKNMQSEMRRNHTKDDYGWMKCNTDPAKTAAVFSMQEQLVETMAWKKM